MRDDHAVFIVNFAWVLNRLDRFYFFSTYRLCVICCHLINAMLKPVLLHHSIPLVYGLHVPVKSESLQVLSLGKAAGTDT